MRKIALIAGAIVALIALGLTGYAIFNSNSTSPDSDSTTSSRTVTTSASSQSSDNGNTGSANVFTLAEVQRHSSASSCWLVIEGKVYDVTNFVNQHPGGQEILKGCGKDATSMFLAEGHSASARSTMQRYLIGDLQK